MEAEKSLVKKFIHYKVVPRIISATILAPILIFILYKGGYAFTAMLSIIGFLMFYEWNQMVKGQVLWNLVGALYILPLLLSLLNLRGLENGFNIIIYLLLIIWSTDIGAYIIGISVGGPKLATFISPTKTMSGAIAGIICAFLVSYLLIKYKIVEDQYLLFSVILSVLGQAGDLFESYLKRKFKIKDSSQIIPGHGGILDRTDSLIFTAPVLYFVKVFAF